MSPDDKVRIRHMADAAEAALRFAQGRTRADLESDDMLVFALVRAAEVIGEAAARITPSGRSELPAVPWGQIVGMRNRLVHAYFDVDRTILWETVQQAIPDLLKQLRNWISSQKDDLA